MTQLFTGDLYTQRDIADIRYSEIHKHKNGVVRYERNAAGFRCDEFVPTNKPVIVFIGCSVTFGEGLYIEETWSHMVMDRLRQTVDPDLKYFNLAKGGCGMDTMVRALLAFTKHYRPDLIVGLIPDRHRAELSLPPNILYNALARSRNSIAGLPKEAAMMVQEYEQWFLTSDEFNGYRLAKNMQMIDLIAQLNDSRVMLSCWAGNDIFLRGLNEQFGHMMSEAQFRWSRDPKTFARDGSHPGAADHAAFAEQMIPLIETEIRARLNTA